VAFSELLGLWVGALLTLMIFSFLYKDNPFYKFAEHLFVGVSAAFWMVQGFWATIMPNLIARIFPAQMADMYEQVRGHDPDYFYLIPGILGLILLTRLITPIAWMSRWAMAFIIGYTAGTNLTRYLASDFMAQVHSTMSLPLIVQTNGVFSLGASLSNILIVGGVLCGLSYFFFSKEHTGAFGKASRFGIWVLMAAFGASFGYTVMARISLLIGRFEYLGSWIQQGILMQ
jgi:hypothetical protein